MDDTSNFGWTIPLRPEKQVKLIVRPPHRSPLSAAFNNVRSGWISEYMSPAFYTYWWWCHLFSLIDDDRLLIHLGGTLPWFDRIFADREVDSSRAPGVVSSWTRKIDFRLRLYWSPGISWLAFSSAKRSLRGGGADGKWSHFKARWL